MGSRELMRFIEGAEPGVVILGADLSIRHVSQSLVLLFGIEADRLLAQGLLSFHGEAAAQRIRESVRLVRETQHPLPVTVRFLTRHGEDRHFLVKLLPLIGREALPGTICALLFDVTAVIASARRTVRIPVSVRDEIQLLRPEEIAFVQADDIYSRVTTAAGEFHCDLSLTSLEKRLSTEAFFRIHRSYLVNVDCVRKVHRGTSQCTVSLAGLERRLPISRHRMAKFFAAIGLE